MEGQLSAGLGPTARDSAFEGGKKKFDVWRVLVLTFQKSAGNLINNGMACCHCAVRVCVVLQSSDRMRACMQKKKKKEE